MAKRLVVLASGWAKQDFLWTPLAKRLEMIGYDTVCAHFPHNGFGHIEDSAEKIGCVIEEMRPFYEHLTFVGHSMGGLLGRFLIQGMDMAQIDSYVSLGTPHEGTWAAWLGPCLASRSRASAAVSPRAAGLATGTGSVRRSPASATSRHKALRCWKAS